MRRSSQLAISSVALFGLAAAFFLSSTLFAQRPAAKNVPKAIYSRNADFFIANNNALTDTHVPQVNGNGGFPVRLNIVESGYWDKPRKLQVFVAVYTRGGAGMRAGKFVTSVTHPDVMSTEIGKEKSLPFAMDIPLLPGDYIAYVFICDPSKDYVGDVKGATTFPEANLFPGT